MRTPLVLAATGLFVAAYALVPVAAALPASLGCGFDLDYWSLGYACHVNSAGADGTLVWCPDPLLCAGGDVLACWVDLTPPYYCQAG